MARPRPYTIGLIFPLIEELRVCHAILSTFGRENGANRLHTLRSRRQQNNYYLLELESLDVHIWFAHLREMGNGPAQDLTTELIDLIYPDLIMAIGIAGSLDSDLFLADVACARTISDIIDAAKIGDLKSTLEASPPQYELLTVSRSIDTFRCYTEFFSAAEYLDPNGFITWREICIREAAKFGLTKSHACRQVASQLPGETLEALRERLSQHTTMLAFRPWPRTHISRFASGAVLSSAAFEVKKQGREYNVVETEAAGIARACANGLRPTAFSVLRGISDFADGAKGLLQTNTFGTWRHMAVFNALHLFLWQLKLPAFSEVLLEARRFRHAQLVGGFDKYTILSRTEARSVFSRITRDLNYARMGELVRGKRGTLKNGILEANFDEFVEALSAVEIDGHIQSEKYNLHLLMDYAAFLANFAPAHSSLGSYAIEKCFRSFEEYFHNKFGVHPSQNIADFSDEGLFERYHHAKSIYFECRGFLRRAIAQRQIAFAARRLQTAPGVSDRERHQRCILCMRSQLMSSAPARSKDADSPMDVAYLPFKTALQSIAAMYENKRKNPPQESRLPAHYWGFQEFRTLMVMTKASIWASHGWTKVRQEHIVNEIQFNLLRAVECFRTQEEENKSDENCDRLWQVGLIEYYTGTLLDLAQNIDWDPALKSKYDDQSRALDGCLENIGLTQDNPNLENKASLYFASASKKFIDARVSALCLVNLPSRFRRRIQLAAHVLEVVTEARDDLLEIDN